MNRSKLILLLLIVGSLLSTSALAQSPCNEIWWTGWESNKFFMDFTSGSLQLSLDYSSIPYTSREGTAGYTIDGDLWMYTDGVNFVDNRGPSPVVVTNAWTGNESTEFPAAIFPLPGNHSLFGVVLNSNPNPPISLSFAIVDFAPVPAVIVKPSEAIYEYCTETIGLVESTSGSGGVWVLSCSWEVSEDLSFELIAIEFDLYGNIVRNVSTILPGNGPDPLGVIQFNVVSNRMVIVAHFTIMIASFDQSTGVISDVTVVATGVEVGYSGAISDNGQYVYYTFGTSGWNGYPMQYEISTGIARPVLNTGLQKCGGMMLGPDGKLYIAKSDTDTIGVINNPNELCPDACGYSEITLPSGARSGLNFHMNTICLDEPSASPTPSTSFSESPSLSASVSESPSGSPTESSSLSPSSSLSLSGSVSESPSGSSTESSSLSPSTSLSASVSESPSGSPTESSSLSPSSSLSLSGSVSESPSGSPTRSSTASRSESHTPLESSSPSTTSTRTPISTPTRSNSATPSFRASPSHTPHCNGYQLERGSIVCNPHTEIVELEVPPNFPTVIVRFVSRNPSDPKVISPVVDISFIDLDVSLADFSVEVCFLQNENPYGSVCLGYLDESRNPPQWRCEDECLEENAEGKTCGITSHFTNFALVQMDESCYSTSSSGVSSLFGILRNVWPIFLILLILQL